MLRTKKHDPNVHNLAETNGDGKELNDTLKVRKLFQHSRVKTWPSSIQKLPQMSAIGNLNGYTSQATFGCAHRGPKS